MSAVESTRFPFRRSSQPSDIDDSYLQANKVSSQDYSNTNGEPYSHVPKMADVSNEFRFQDSNGAPLRKTDTIGSISLTPEQFERMYLGPQNEVKGDLRKTFGNPTPIGLGGFLLAFTPLVCTFMGWRGAAGEGAATVGSLYFLGGMLAILASIGEFILGNSFPSCFFGVFGGFFITFGATLTPSFNAYIAFAPDPSDPTTFIEGTVAPPFLASIGFLAAFTGVFTFILTIAALRTNLMFFLAFLSLTLAFMFFTASRFYGAQGDMANYQRYELIAGATGFFTAMIGWYLLTVEILTTVDFPVNLPVFDLSQYIPSGTELAKRKRREQRAADLEAEQKAE